MLRIFSSTIPRLPTISTTPLSGAALRVSSRAPRTCLSHVIRLSSTDSAPKYQGDIPLDKFLTQQLMDARKTRDSFRTNVLRTVIGELQTEQKSLASQKGITPGKLEDNAMKNVYRAIKKRKAAAEEYRLSNLAETAENEEREAAYLESILPRRLDEGQLREAIESVYADIRSDDSLFPTDRAPNPRKIVERISELVEASQGKGSFSSGSVYGIVMPMLERERVFRTKSK